MTIVLKLDGIEVARITGSDIEHGRRVDPKAGMHITEMVADPHIYVQRTEGKTLWILNVSVSERMTVEELP